MREPKPTYAHNITALSVATFFTLLAQGRLVDERSSQEISTILQNGCFLAPNGFGDGLSRIGGTLLTRQKCGISRDILHESVLVKRDQFHYVAIALTINAADFPFDVLIKDLDKLIQDKNP